MQERRRYAAKVIRQDSFKLFGKLLRKLMKQAGISQKELAARAVKLRDGWADEGFFDKEESGDLTQSSISKVLSGKWGRPYYGQVFFWLRVLEEALGSEFPRDLRDDMFRLVRYVPPETIVEAYERRKDV